LGAKAEGKQPSSTSPATPTQGEKVAKNAGPRQNRRKLSQKMRGRAKTRGKSSKNAGPRQNRRKKLKMRARAKTGGKS